MMFVAQQPFSVTSEHAFTLSVGRLLCPFPSWLPYSIHNTIVHCLPFLLSLSLPGTRQSLFLVTIESDNRSHSCCHPVRHSSSYCCRSVCHPLGHSVFPSYILVEDHCFLTRYSNLHSCYNLKFKIFFSMFAIPKCLTYI